jgi:hypothetical protein
VSALRVFLAVLVLGIGIAGAVALATTVTESGPSRFESATGCGYGGGDTCFAETTRTPSWVIPVAVLVGFAGVGGCAAILASGYQRGARA